MIKYNVTQTTNILAIDDVRLATNFKRIDETGSSRNMSEFRSGLNLAQLTSKGNFFRIAVVISRLEIITRLALETSKEKAELSGKSLFCLLYRKTGDESIFYIEFMIADDINAASTEFHSRLSSYENVDNESIAVSKVASIATHQLEAMQSVESSKLTITVKETVPGKSIIMEGIHAFEAFGRKVYACTVE